MTRLFILNLRVLQHVVLETIKSYTDTLYFDRFKIVLAYTKRIKGTATFRLNNGLSGSTNLFSVGLSVPKATEDFAGAQSHALKELKRFDVSFF